jgi:transposase
MAITLPDTRLESDEVIEALRLRALRAWERGTPETDIADVLGVRRETVSRWVTAYRSGGLDAVPGSRPGRPVGSGRLLSDDQAERLQQLLRTHQPEDLGIPAPLWNRRAVRDLIRREYAIDLAVRTVGSYLARWRFTAKVPTRHRRDRDPDEADEWVRETYPAIAERAEAEGATLLWCDEVGVAADAHPAKGYAPVGEPATMAVPGPHIRAGQVSAISNDGEVHFMTFTGTMTAAVFLTFLTRLLRGTVGKVFLIADRHPAHTDAEVDAWVAAHRERLELFFLPRRSPEVNPDEYLNNDLKGRVHESGLPSTSAEVRSHIQHFMRRLLNLPGHVRSYFQHPSVQYAAA